MGRSLPLFFEQHKKRIPTYGQNKTDRAKRRQFLVCYLIIQNSENTHHHPNIEILK